MHSAEATKTTRWAGELAAIAFFSYTAWLSVRHGMTGWRLAVAVCAPVAILGAAYLETVYSRAWTRHARTWVLPAVVLGGYWQMGWFAAGHARAVELEWVRWDRELLDGWGLRRLIEQGVPGLAWWLELSYLLLYSVPAACLGVLYWNGERRRAGEYLAVFALGTLAVYGMLPLVPVESPRTVFAGMDAPGVTSVWRTINVGILDRMDIATSVFPSGHVAVAFSSALGMRRAMPEARGWFWFFLALAVSVFAATVYGRYHYAVDGLASIAVSLVAWSVLEAYDRMG